jgi:integrase
VVPTFKAAAIALHTEHSKTFKSAKHAAQWLSSLEADVFPLIGARPVNSLGSADVLRVLTPIWTVKPETARRLKQRMKLVFEWTKASGYFQGDNPADGITKVLPKHKGDKQHHAALPFSEVPGFLVALRTEPRTSEPVRLAFELLILTATRTNEVQLATWSEVDLDARTWTIPAERMKSAREHRVPLSPRSVEILKRARRLTTGHGFIFPGSKPGRPLSNMTFLKAAGRVTTAILTPHGFRSSFRDWTEEKTTTPRTVVEAALAHVVRDKTEAAYRRTDLFDRRRDLMDRWAQFATRTAASVAEIRA